MLNHSSALNMALHYRLPLLYVSFYKCLKISVHRVSALYLFLVIMRLLRERNIPNVCVFFKKELLNYVCVLLKTRDHCYL